MWHNSFRYTSGRVRSAWWTELPRNAMGKVLKKQLLTQG